ncbi:DUF4382 domain-containing protein [Algiphilus sp.]|uniref:DUF4382 domain-containing protein n=1 Tax=Algiphilus sp. TaxID=1872431 RepID=UPI003B52C3B0
MRHLIFLPLALVLSACDQGEITVRITDAPADAVNVAFVAVEGVDIEAEDGSFTRFDFDPPRRIDIAGLRQGRSETLLQNASIDAGAFSGLRLRFAPDFVPPDVINSDPIVLDNGTTATLDYVRESIRVALAFSIDELERETVLLDVDLRASLLQDDDDLAANRYRFDPVIRAIRQSDAGDIQGTVAADLVNQSPCFPAVYLYQGRNAETTTLADREPPLNSRQLDNLSITGGSFRFSNLAAGGYTVAFTCDADADDPEDDAPEVNFLASRSLDVDAGRSSQVTLP